MKMLPIMLFLIATFSTQMALADYAIDATRNGDVTITQPQSFATLLRIPLKTNQSPPDLGNKYVVLSNATVTVPVIDPPCTGFQVYQSTLYQGLISSVTIDLQNTTGGNCDSEVQKVVNADTITLVFKTALLGDGSGTDIAPITLTIHSK